MASAAATSSLHFLSLTPKTHSPKPFCNSLSPFSIINNKPLSTSSSSIKFFQTSRVLKLAVSSDFGVEVDDASDAVVENEVSQVEEQEPEPEPEPERVASFSPDLKIFVGNLPFSCDSATLAGLFESSGNVEMVEVHFYVVSCPLSIFSCIFLFHGFCYIYNFFCMIAGSVCVLLLSSLAFETRLGRGACGFKFLLFTVVSIFDLFIFCTEKVI